MLLRAGRREVEAVVADPLLLGAVTGGEGVDGAMLSNAPMPTMREIQLLLLKNTNIIETSFAEADQCCYGRADHESRSFQRPRLMRRVWGVVRRAQQAVPNGSIQRKARC